MTTDGAPKRPHDSSSNASTAWIVGGGERGPFGRVTAAVVPAAVVLLVGLAVIGARHLARARADARRFRRLYEATSRVGRLGDLDVVLASLATEAAQLAAGTGAVCCTVDGRGAWWGMRVDGSANRRLDETAVSWLAGQGRSIALPADDLPAAVRVGLGADGALLVSALVATDGVPVVLAVTRARRQHRDEAAALEVLDAFAATCSLVLANARLFDEVHDALRTQIDLNRQKAEFVAAVSHELRTPLAVVLGAIQATRRLGERVPVDAREELLGTAEGGGHRLRRLIEDLLLVASNEHKARQNFVDAVDAVGVLDAVARECASVGGPRCHVIALGPLPPLVTDVDKLRRIVTNLVENAGKYAPGSTVELDAVVEGGELAITVADHGPGIEPADRQRVFEPFVQLDQSSTRCQGGTGLGLHLCRTMADVIGGRLELADRPDGGAGAHFALYLPISVPAEPAAVVLGGHS